MTVKSEKIEVRVTESGETIEVVVLKKNVRCIEVVLGKGVHSVPCELKANTQPLGLRG